MYILICMCVCALIHCVSGCMWWSEDLQTSSCPSRSSDLATSSLTHWLQKLDFKIKKKTITNDKFQARILFMVVCKPLQTQRTHLDTLPHAVPMKQQLVHFWLS